MMNMTMIVMIDCFFIFHVYSFLIVLCLSFISHSQTPFLTESSFEWDIDPANVRVHVKASSVDLGPVFTVSSFTMHGRVVDETGAPMKGVCVRVNSNGKEGECSDETGAYYLTDMQERLYMIDVGEVVDEWMNG